MKPTACILLMLMLLCGCAPTPSSVEAVGCVPPISPDYADVAVPPNIAPLNFCVKDSCDAVYAVASAAGVEIKSARRGCEARFAVKDWHRLLQAAAGGDIEVKVATRRGGKWTQYDPFAIHVLRDSIDPYLTYRLIEPDYEIFSRLAIEERCLEDFSRRNICDHNAVGNRCMNCHTANPARPGQSFLYVRGEGGGMVLCDGAALRKLNLRTADMASGSVYAQFSPDGRYLAFSTNVIIPGFHANPAKRLEVFDTKSDIYVADLAENRILRSPLLADSLWLETFPAFAPDGKSIYFCTARRPRRAIDVDSLQYSLCRIGFDGGKLGAQVDTLVRAEWGKKQSVCHPRVSPCGRYVLYSVADYGTFPIWHPEADLEMLDLATGNTKRLAMSDKSDTYHSWSSSGRWFAFASKGGDGLYGKVYFCHVGDDGEVSKPFVLPQESPTFYETFLKSHNVPELCPAPAAFDAFDVADALELPAENFR